MMLNTKEIALKVADSLRNKVDGISHMQSNQGLVAFAEALIAELAKQNEPVCEWVKSDNGNYPVQKWAKDYVAMQGDKLYTSDQVAAAIAKATEPLEDQLAAEQLNNKRLRDALLPMTQGFYWLKHENFVLAERLLSEPLDTSALDAYVAEKVKISRDIDEKQIAYLFEERSLLTRQRDLAVEWLKQAEIVTGTGRCAQCNL